jgi:putative ABC transport system substrate-binding protein
VRARRDFLANVALVLATPRINYAQATGKTYRVGFLANYAVPPTSTFHTVFVAALRELGYVAGKNLVVEIRSANYDPKRFPVLAAELVQLGCDVIVTAGDGEVRAAKQASSRIPIVMAPSGDPVGAGYVASLARPGGNVTGFSWQSPDLSPKLLEVLKEAVPGLTRVAVLWNGANPVKVRDFDEVRGGAKALGMRVDSIEIRVASDLDTAFATITHVRRDALLVLVDEVLTASLWVRIADFAMKQRLPSIIGQEQYPAAGGLMAYAPSMVEVMGRAAAFVDKILKGANPADLPVEQPTRFRLVINLKAAKALGLTMPQTLLLRADQLIE